MADLYNFFNVSLLIGNDIDDIGLCAFCRLVDVETDEERNEQVKILVEKGNAYAHSVLARYYAFGQNGYTRNQEKSNKVISTQNEMYALSYKLSAKSCEKLFHLKGCLA